MADNGTINDQFAEQFKPMSDAFQSALELMLSSILGRRAGIKRKKIGSLDFRDVKEIVSEKVVFLTAQAIKGLRGYVCVIIKGNIVNKIVDELFSGKKGINDILPGDVKKTKEHLADRFFQDLAEKLHSAFSGEFSFGQGHWEVLEKGWDIPALFGEDEALAQVVYQGAAKGDNAMEAYVLVEQGIFLSLVHSEANGPGLTDEGLRHQAPAFEAPECGARAQESRNIDMLMDIPVVLSVELGSRKMAISEILNIGQGSVIELNKEVGEPVDILVNNTLVAKGEVVVIEEHFGVRVTEIADTRARLESLRG